MMFVVSGTQIYEAENHMKRTAIWPVLLSFLFGCQDAPPTDLPLAPEYATPVATGIIVTSPASPQIIDVWGNPADHVPSSQPGGGIPSAFEVPPVYPNPSDGWTVIGFGLPVASDVAVWIVPARGAGEAGNDFTSAWGALLPSPQRVAIAYPIPLSRRSPGFYVLHWDGRDGGGNPVPSGFYRVYIRFGENIYWRDMFLYRDLTDIPAGMRAIR
jgi:hypothetical protein